MKKTAYILIFTLIFTLLCGCAPSVNSSSSDSSLEEGASSAEVSIEPSSEALSSGSSSFPSLPPCSSSSPVNPPDRVVQPVPPNIGGPQFMKKVEQQVVYLINKERQAQGLRPLAYSKNLQMGARLRSKELCENRSFKHLRPDGREWYTVLIEEVPTYFDQAGENLADTKTSGAEGYFSPISADYWVSIWKESPSHYANILEKDYTHCGVGIYYEEVGDEFIFYATTLFAKF